MNYSLILLCAGSGKRTGLKYNKIFYKINNQTPSLEVSTIFV